MSCVPIQGLVSLRSDGLHRPSSLRRLSPNEMVWFSFHKCPTDISISIKKCIPLIWSSQSEKHLVIFAILDSVHDLEVDSVFLSIILKTKTQISVELLAGVHCPYYVRGDPLTFPVLSPTGKNVKLSYNQKQICHLHALGLSGLFWPLTGGCCNIFPFWFLMWSNSSALITCHNVETLPLIK